MKKLIIISFILTLMCGVVYAEEGIWDRIKDHSIKVACAYNTDGHKGEGAIGGAIEKGLFGYINIDLDAFITTDLSETTSSDEKNLLTGISYNYYFGKDKSWSTYLGAGFLGNDILDIQKMRDNDSIELDKAVYFGIGKKFN